MATDSEQVRKASGIRLLEAPTAEMDADARLEDFTRYFGRTLGRQAIYAGSPFVYQALVYAVRDRLMERWNRTNLAVEALDGRRVFYLSLEYLMGRLLGNALHSLGIYKECEAAMQRLGVPLGAGPDWVDSGC